MPHGTNRLGTAQENNLHATGIIRRVIAPSFGPKGLSKLITTKWGDAFFASDCAMILEKADHKHPIARMMVELAKVMYSKHGDGSATAVLLSCSLIERGFDLMRMGIHPSIIVDGFEKAKDESLAFLDGFEERQKLSANGQLARVVATCLSKLPDNEANHLTTIICSAVSHVCIEKGKFDTELVKIVAVEGAPVLESDMIEGMVIDSEVLSGRMPYSVRKARIALVEELLDVRKTKYKAEVNIESPQSLGSLQRVEHDYVAEITRAVIESGATVLLTHKGIEEPAQSMLVTHRILAVRKVGLVDLRRISKATGARIAYSPSDLAEDTLGFATLVEQRALGGKKFLFIDGCKEPRAVSIVLRSGTQRSADNLERLCQKAIRAIETLAREPALVPGGGAVEFALADHLGDFALQFSGREQHAIRSFADALLSIVEDLARNCGMQPMMAVAKLRAMKNHGGWINSHSRNVETRRTDMPVESLEMKKAVISSSCELATRILRVGDVFQAKEIHTKKERETDYP